MEVIIKEVNPVIIYPNCIKSGKKQDCFNCKLMKENLCKSPRGMCVRPYHNHPKGCPNYGKKLGCPPNLPMFDQIFDITKPVYAIITTFNLSDHIMKVKKLHPSWTNYQLRNARYWQGTDRKNHKQGVAVFNNEYSNLGFVVTNWPEGLGVDLITTLKQINVDLKFPVEKNVYRVSLAGIIKDKKYIEELGLSEIKGKYGEKVLGKKIK